MDIPPHIHILSTIKTGSVYYFEEEQLKSTEPHYFIVLNKNPRSDEFLILVCASSQVEKRKSIIRRLKLPSKTLVIVKPAQYSIFCLDTVIDCNSVFEKTSQYLIDKLQQCKLKVCSEAMPEEIIKQLIEGVVASPQVAKRVQVMLRDSS
ncbi:MAG: hypothetical protein PHI73_00465 [Patescibacteria group bacterium]|nr:hypothetical protein [Patescibacteria group bacterium]